MGELAWRPPGRGDPGGRIVRHFIYCGERVRPYSSRSSRLSKMLACLSGGTRSKWS